MTELNLFDRPQCIFNVDETGFQCDRGDTFVLAPRGARIVDAVSNNNTKAMFTVNWCVNAIGEFTPLYVLYKSKELHASWMTNGPEGCGYNNSPSGKFLLSFTFSTYEPK